MRGFRAFVTVGICVAMTAAAKAADPPGTWNPLPDLRKQIYTDLVSGWYARGDLGWRKHSIESIEVTGPVPVTDFRFPNTLTMGFGGGYKHKWFRADVTLDYGLKKVLLADTVLGANYYSANIDAITLLANAYLDLGTWGGFTPYIGAGGGMTQLRTSEVAIAGTTQIASGSKWNASWAAMAGVSYQLTPNILLDVGYRYLKLGDAVSGPQTIPATGLFTFKDITAQEIRAGVRWMLD